MTTVLIAGATGMLGRAVSHHLADRLRGVDGSELRLLVRPGTTTDLDRAGLVEQLTSQPGVVAVEGDLTDPAGLERITAGVDVVVSTVQGGADVVVDGQVALARAAEASGVRRFLASDFAIDLFHGPAGMPSFELRRRADEVLDRMDLEVVHLLTGGFLDLMLSPGNPSLVDADRGVVSFWGEGTETFNMTTVDDTARIAAYVALDEAVGPGVHRFAAAETSFRDIARVVREATGREVDERSHGSLDELRVAIAAETDPGAQMFLWYQLALATTPPFAVLENSRYPELRLTTLVDHVRAAYAPAA